MAKPLISIPFSASTIVIDGTPFSFSLDESNSYTVSWDSSQVTDGSHSIIFSFCIRQSCDVQKRMVVVQNAGPAIPPVIQSGQSRPHPSREKSVSLPDDLLPVVSVYSILPSPNPGAFYLYEPGQSVPLFRSAGESWSVKEGSYDAKLSFFNSFIREIALSRVLLDARGILVSIRPVLFSSFIPTNDGSFFPTQIASVSFPYPSADNRVRLSFRENERGFYCTKWDDSASSCAVTWLPIFRLGDALEFSAPASSLVVALATPADDLDSSLVPSYTLHPSNRDGNFLFARKGSASLFSSGSDSLLIPEGQYGVRAAFNNNPISQLGLSGVKIDHNGALLQFDTLLPFDPVRFPSRVEKLSIGFPLQSAHFAIHSDFNSDVLFRCEKWDDALSQCARPWLPFSPSFLSSGETILGFSAATRLNSASSDVNVLARFSPEDRLLAKIILDLKRLHSSKRFFAADSMLLTSPVFSRLLSDFEMDLECPLSPNENGISPTALEKQTEIFIPAAPERDGDSGFDTPFQPESFPLSSEKISETILAPAFDSPFPDPFPVSDDSFFTNSWEDNLPEKSPFRQSENRIECGGLLLQNQFVSTQSLSDTAKTIALNSTLGRVKQQFTLTNTASSPRTRLVNIRLVTPFAELNSDTNDYFPTSRYQLVPTAPKTVVLLSADSNETSPLIFTISQNPILRFVSAVDGTVGTYDWSDLFANGVAPHTVVHQRHGLSVIETIMEVTILPGQTLLFDPTLDLGNAVNFHASWNGGSASDSAGAVNTTSSNLLRPTGLGVILADIDNNGYSNDIIISASQADVNSKTDAGAVYVIRDIDKKSGPLDLGNVDNLAVSFLGSQASNQLGNPNTAGKGVQVVNADGNAYSNDLFISAPFADFQAADSGSLYLIKDIDKVSGQRDLNADTFFSARWDGAAANDNFPSSFTNNATFGAGGEPVQLVNVDGNSVSNDLLITAVRFDTNSKTDPGVVFLIKDAFKRGGINSMSSSANFDASWVGSMASDFLGATGTSGSGVQLVNVDGNTASNDLVLTASFADQPKANSGSVYLIKDVNTLAGVFDLNNTNHYSVRWTGAVANTGADALGMVGTQGGNNGSQGVQVVNTDGNVAANDILIGGSLIDIGVVNRGAVYYVKDINTLSGNRDLNNVSNFTARWMGFASADQLGNTNGGSPGIQLVNVDGNAYSNDLLLSGYLLDINSKVNVGGVYLINDIVNRSGTQDLTADPNSYTSVWSGSTSGDQLGDGAFTGVSVQLVNIDNNVAANDLVLSSPGVDTYAKDTGAVYLIRDINTTNSGFDLNMTAFFSIRWSTVSAIDYLSDTNNSGPGVQVVNVDGNAYSNDLLLTGVNVDVNSKANAGAVYLIRDIDRVSNGIYSLDSAANYSVQWNGSNANDFLGMSQSSGSGVQLVNVDNNSHSNDLLITDMNADINGTDQGAVYLIRDIGNFLGTRDLNNLDHYSTRWSGGSARDQLGETLMSGSGVQLINSDNNSYSNDLLVTAALVDTNGRTDAGMIYLIRDIAVANLPDYTFVLNLPSSGCTNGKGNITGGTACQRAWIETADTTGVSDENQVQPEGQVAASSATPFFSYDNQSTNASDFNIFLDLNASFPATLVLKTSTAGTGYQGQCTNTPSGCKVVTSTVASVGKAVYSSNTQDLNLFFWGDFIAASAGETDRNVDSNASSSV